MMQSGVPQENLGGPIYRGLKHMDVTLTPTVQHINNGSDYQINQGAMVTSIDDSSFREPSRLLDIKHQSTATL